MLGATAAVVMTTRRQPASVAMQQAMRTFNAAMPMDVVNSSCALVADWFRGQVDFPVQPPRGGGRPLRGRPAADRAGSAGRLPHLRALSGHKLAVMVFDGNEDEIDGAGAEGGQGYGHSAHHPAGGLERGLPGPGRPELRGHGDLDADSLTNFADRGL